MTKEVELVLQEYVGRGLGKLEAIRTALDEERIERDVDGSLKLRGVKRRPGRQLLPL